MAKDMLYGSLLEPLQRGRIESLAWQLSFKPAQHRNEITTNTATNL